MITSNLLEYIDIKCVTHIGGYIKYGNLCHLFNFSNKPNIYADVKKRLYALLFNVIKKYTCN